MKKTYIAPVVEAYKIDVANLCAVSTGSADVYETQKGASSALGRGGFVDDSED